MVYYCQGATFGTEIVYMMKKLLILAAFLLISHQAWPLQFSADSMRAFDGKLWNGNSGDDSIIIKNRENYSVVIDSIIIQIDPTRYARFDIGWIEKRKDSSALRHFSSDSAAIAATCNSNSIILGRYNSGIVSKISLQAHESMTIFSPYFSKECSIAGWIIDCFGPCYPGQVPVFIYFPGTMIFVAEGKRDSIQLACEHIDWIARTVSLLPNPRPAANQLNSNVQINARGQKLSLPRKLDQFRALEVRKGSIRIGN